jgi:uncharacterized membrane protein YhdT
MKDMLYAVLGLVSVIVAVWQMYVFLNQDKAAATNTPLIASIVCIVLAIIFGVLFMVGKVNKSEDIHVTE